MKIALIDQHPVLRSGMRIFLRSHFQNLTMLQTSCLQSFSQGDDDDSFDIIIIGMTEEANGIDNVALKRIMRENPESSFVVYAGKLQQELAVSLMNEGVSGYLLKRNHPDELVKCIQTVVKGDKYLCKEVQIPMDVY
ncbi:response regulator [Dyadobacter psychrophilus]|uniref:Response regulator receiver domain-containing protein n=1 Tax=Dyadobacter psychrophilus TaxID=651661 RepID=A0A1T5BVH3_9BACT|nr:response regulator [Dyadobacter psychrophilus]SKB51157.1 Response regulator receiver domain-containing protein [Dyadobacter psychrophilus]